MLRNPNKKCITIINARGDNYINLLFCSMGQILQYLLDKKKKEFLTTLCMGGSNVNEESKIIPRFLNLLWNSSTEPSMKRGLWSNLLS